MNERLDRIESMNDARRQATVSMRPRATASSPLPRTDGDTTRGIRSPERRDGSVPLVPALSPEVSHRLLIDAAIAPSVVEQYRRLGATLHDLQVNRALKSLIVTSALPEDGKTITAVNLAFTLSDSYARKVLLIDADMRRPSIQALWSLPDTAGLRDALDAPTTELPTIDVAPRLSIMTAGRRTINPLASLSSASMRTLLDECERHFDWVILDAPPVGLLPDAQVLSRLTNAVLFVIRAGVTPYDAVDRAISDLGRDTILGTVLNGVNDADIPSSSYYTDYL
jgi:capsular exopolysaccharide synthesis family protein